MSHGSINFVYVSFFCYEMKSFYFYKKAETKRKSSNTMSSYEIMTSSKKLVKAGSLFSALLLEISIFVKSPSGLGEKTLEIKLQANP